MTNTTASASVPHSDDSLDRFVARIRDRQAAPGWMLFKKYFSPEPNPEVVPAIWRYAEMRPLLAEACKVIPQEQAERRVLALENPGMPGQARATRTLVAALQIVGPGDVARAHRHSAQAFRLILEGDVAYTTVNGERAAMRPGDHVITPAWTWHDHQNTGDKEMVFLDGLDLHLVNSFDAGFFEPHAEHEQALTRQDGLADLQVGRNLVVMGQHHDVRNTPLLSYPYVQTLETLNGLASRTPPDPWHGYWMKYANPLTGGWVTSTIATTIRLLPAGFSTRPYRSTDSSIFVVLKGQGQSRIGGQTIRWNERDVFVAPSWHFQQHEASSDAVVFSYSDRAAQENLGLFREERRWVAE